MENNEMSDNVKQMTNDVKTIKNILLFCLMATIITGILSIYISTNPSAVSF